MSTAEAAGALGVNASRIRQYVRAGALTPRREDTPRGPVLWFKKEDIDQLREERARIEADRRAGKKPGRPLKKPGAEQN